MSLTACVLCHRDELRPRWVGDLLMTFCDLCGCLHVPEPAPLVGVSTEIPPPRSLDAHAHQSSEPVASEPVAVPA